jgi:hypothetical protein
MIYNPGLARALRHLPLPSQASYPRNVAPRAGPAQSQNQDRRWGEGAFCRHYTLPPNTLTGLYGLRGICYSPNPAGYVGGAERVLGECGERGSVAAGAGAMKRWTVGRAGRLRTILGRLLS